MCVCVCVLCVTFFYEIAHLYVMFFSSGLTEIEIYIALKLINKTI